MGFFLKVVNYAMKYGKKAVQWCWEHKKQIIEWGLYAFEIIDHLFG